MVIYTSWRWVDGYNIQKPTERKHDWKRIAKQKKFRRSITTANALKAGQEITYNDILFKRPGTGIPADRYKEIIGRHVCRDIEENKTLFWEDLVK